MPSKQVNESGKAAEVPLILGGHSFIQQLGNDLPASEQEQHRIVESCLNHGITWFDTTYQPERVALGKVLHALGRREEATVLAWNFFTDFSPGEPVGEATYFRPGHIDRILEQLHTSYVDGLVMVALDDPEENQRQEELAIEWRRKGYVRFLGLWILDTAILEEHCGANPFRLAIQPFNILTKGAARIFEACRMRGLETVATSPFFRGWELDRMIARAAARGHGDASILRPKVADLMLRFSLFQHNVDRVIVAMRKTEWIARNLASVARGALSVDEQQWLQRLRGLDMQ